MSEATREGAVRWHTFQLTVEKVEATYIHDSMGGDRYIPRARVTLGGVNGVVEMSFTVATKDQPKIGDKFTVSVTKEGEP